MVTRRTVPTRVFSTCSREAKARAASSVGWKTTLRNETRTSPGVPWMTRTPPKAFSTSSAVAAGTGCCSSASKENEGP